MKRRDDIPSNLGAVIKGAIDAGKKEEAKQAFDLFSEEARRMHDGYIDTIASMFTFISEKLGEEAVEQCYRKLSDDLWQPIFMMVKDLGPEIMAQTFASACRAHGSDFYIEEDDEKMVVVSNYCGAGGKLIKEGKLDTSNRSPLNFGTTKKAYDWSFNQEGMPYYCAHCSIWMEILPREWGSPIFKHEFGRQFDDDGNPVNEPCKTIIYKTLPKE